MPDWDLSLNREPEIMCHVKELKKKYEKLLDEKIINGSPRNAFRFSQGVWKYVKEISVNPKNSEELFWCAMIAYRSAHVSMHYYLQDPKSNALHISDDQITFAVENLEKLETRTPFLLMALIYRYAVLLRISQISKKRQSERNDDLRMTFKKIQQRYSEIRQTGYEDNKLDTNDRHEILFVRSLYYNLIELLCYVSGEKPVEFEPTDGAMTRMEKKLLNGAFYILRSKQVGLCSETAYSAEIAMTLAISENPDKIIIYTPDHKDLFSSNCQNANHKVYHDFNINEIKLLFYSMLDKKIPRPSNSDALRQMISRFNKEIKELCNTDKNYIDSGRILEQNPVFDKSLILIITGDLYDSLIENRQPFTAYQRR